MPTARKVDKDSIEALASAVFDTGRRGNPKLGCDCVQCFGYCMTDPDVALRHRLEAAVPVVDEIFLDTI